MPALGGWVLGVLAVWTLPVALPTVGIGLALLAAAALGPLRRWRWTAALCLGLAWAAWHAHDRLADRLPSASTNEPVWLEGEVVGLPVAREDQLEFEFRVSSPHPRLENARLRVRWYREAPAVRAGEHWRLALRLRPARGRVNFSGPDAERGHFAAGIAALATVTREGGERLATASSWSARAWRQDTRDRVASLLAGQPGGALVLALAVADRSAMEPALGRAIRVTGTGHLLAISGLHVGLVALFGYGVARAVCGALPWRWAPLNAHLPAVVTGLAGAGVYAVLAGMGTSTRRALIMLAVFAAAGLLRRALPPWRALLLAAAVVLMFDPLAPLSAGFWLSFGAVAVLLLTFVPRARRGGRVAGLLRAQCAIVLALAPLGMAWFQQVALGGLLANLVAIPWVSLVTLPLTLLGLLALLIDPGLAELPLAMAARSAHWAGQGLRVLAQMLESTAWRTPDPALPTVAIGCLGALALLLPRGARLRGAGAALMLPLILPPGGRPEAGGITLELLDVGQGLAAVVDTRHYRLLFDTGPGQPGRWDLHDAVLAPALAQRGRRLDRVVVSHGDLDHAGGLLTLRGTQTQARFNGNLADGGLPGCHQGLEWTWDGVRFRVLHPSAFLPYLGNDSSCVIGVRGAGGGILLPGDIGAAVERRLANRGGAGYRVLVAPHHGSRSSSSDDLLAWARPERVLIAAGADNRFGFPHPEVRRRLAHRGIPAWNTAECGALRLEIDPGGQLQAHSARRVRAAPWRWPAGPDCP